MKNFRIALVIVVFLVHESITKVLIEKREASAEGSGSIIQKTPQENDAGILAHKQHTSHHHQAKHWGYRNQDKSILPKDWYKNHPKCYGTQQSPINIETNKAYVDENLAEINVLSHSIGDPNPEIWEMQNNGHSVVLYPKSHKFGFTAENSNYELVQMHFHWRGSEHYLNGHRYAAELHLVHRNLNDSNKFAVLGFFLEQINQDNDMLEPIVDSLSELSSYNSKTTINKLSLSHLIPFKIDKYYRYPGSLTTPSCDEVVEWFVIHEPVLTISDPQILEFQSIEDKNGYPMLTNSRPVQEINERYVRKSFYGNGNLRIINMVSSEVNHASTNGSRLKMHNFIILLILALTVLRIF